MERITEPRTVKMFYDTETTGVDPKKHSIIQLAAVIEINGQEVEKFEFKIKPHPKAKIEPEALAVNGRTVEEIMQYEEMSSVYKKLIKILEKHVDRYDKQDKIFLVGFNNLKFDDEFLRMFFSLNGDDFFNSWFWSGSIDVMALAAQYLSHRRHFMPSFKQTRVAQELGIEVDKDRLHEAEYDIELLMQIYKMVTGKMAEETSRYVYLKDTVIEGAIPVFKVRGSYKTPNDRVVRISFIEYKQELLKYGRHDGPEFEYKPGQSIETEKEPNVEDKLGDLF